MIACMAICAPTLLHGGPGAQALYAPCSAEEIYERLLIVQSGREQVIRRHRTNFTERYLQMPGDGSVLATAGYVDFSRNCEEWVRWEIHGAASARVHRITDPRLYAEQIRASVAPSIGLSDGLHSVQLGPDRSTLDHWSGLLEQGISGAIRRGALGCGIPFYEQWFSDYLKLSTPRECLVREDGLVRLTMTPSREQEPRHFLDVYLDDALFCRAIVMRRGEIPVVEAHVDSTSELEGEVVPSTGRILFHYSALVELRLTLSYTAGEPLVSDSFLDTLPDEIHRLGGTASVTDAQGRVSRQLSPPSLEEPSVDRTGPAVGAPTAPAPPAGRSVGRRWSRVGALVVAGIAALVLVRAIRRRGDRA